MKQTTLGLNLNTSRIRKQVLHGEMQRVMPWEQLMSLVALHAPVAKTGRPPFELAMMLRIHCVQHWFGLTDLGAEESLFEKSYLRDFVGLSCTQRIPDRVSILYFRHLLEAHDLSPKIQEVVKAQLAAQVLMLDTVTVVGATLIAVPSSTKNKDCERDPEMQKSKNGNSWYFGMKCHIGVDADSGLVQTVIGTTANVGDVTQGRALLHGQKQAVFADAGYQAEPKRDDGTGVDRHIAMRPGKRKQQKHTTWGALAEQARKLKVSIPAKVEHPFRVIKRQFAHTKARYRGVKKNTAQLMTLFELSNI